MRTDFQVMGGKGTLRVQLGLVALAAWGSLALAGSDPVLLGKWTIPPPGDVRAVAIQGHHAYLAVHDGGMVVIDFSNPASPQRVGGYDGVRYASSVAVSGNYAYLGTSFFGLQVLDISDPANPQPVGRYGTNESISGISLSGAYAYVTGSRSVYSGWINSMQVLDVSTPALPRRASGLATSGTALGLRVADGFAYVGAGVSGLELMDISNPANLQRVSVYTNNHSRAYYAARSGHHVYLRDYGLQVLDISDPAAPQRVGGYTFTGSINGLALYGNLAYVAAGRDLEVLDISDPANPHRVGGHATSGVAQDVVVSGNLIFVPVGTAGLEIYTHATPLRLEVGATHEGAFQMRVSGPAGGGVQVQHSTNLLNWVNLGPPVLLGTTPVPVSDADLSQHTRRFYRVVTP